MRRRSLLSPPRPVARLVDVRLVLGELMKLEPILQYLDTCLRVGEHPDYPNALNGLQVGGSAEVRTVAMAVDASEASIYAAAEIGADLMVVHHGLFWGGLEPVVGRHERRLRLLLKEGIALYSAHLPLDSHREVGNCVLLAKALGLEVEGRLGSYDGWDIGVSGRFSEPVSLDELVGLVGGAVESQPVRLLPGGPESVQSVGVLTGGGGSFVREAAKAGLDAYVTGEAPHHTSFDAAEFRINVLLAGHYATETFGVKAVGQHLEDRFGLKSHFIDQPTGL